MDSASTPTDLSAWEDEFARFLDRQMDGDAAHDRAHIQRVVTSARRLATSEGARMAVVLPAAWLHDCVSLPKDDPRRAQASRLSAKVALQFLDDAGYPAHTHDSIRHAIEAHSYSGNVAPETVEAKVVQDADRLDALGAVGIARCFMVGGQINTSIYHPGDPFCEDREPDDSAYTVDHFYTKLLHLPETMKTKAGRTEARRRADVMRDYLDDLRREINPE